MASRAERDPSDREHAAAEVQAAYRATQTLARPETIARPEDLAERADRWKDPGIPELQRRVADLQLANLRRGIVDPVFTSLASALAAIPDQRFSLLDAACASGYYREVVAALDDREIAYSGCDYSPAMIAAARTRAPGVSFEVRDLTALDLPDASVDAVLLSGVLEHVPAFERAIAHACRVARRYVIAHRLPVSRKTRHEFTLGAQYNIETPRIYFARRPLLQAFAQAGFRPIHEASTYPAAGLRDRLRRRLARRESRTFVFARQGGP